MSWCPKHVNTLAGGLCVCVCARVCALALVSEHLAGLLCDTNEGGPPAQLFELRGAHVCAGGAEASQHVTDGVLHISSIGNLHGPTLRRPESREEEVGIWTCRLDGRGLLLSLLPVLSHSTHVFLHGRVGAHAVEEFVFLAVPLRDLSGALVVACEHSSHHHKVSACTWGSEAKKACWSYEHILVNGT